ncbi:hypothetical protein BJ170DRAFT_606410 [Xylariales sp. AK1849]|nr:hypothetical protein BJ170DRAFT_606410 [Xylariales sp. AK1849]
MATTARTGTFLLGAPRPDAVHTDPLDPNTNYLTRDIQQDEPIYTGFLDQCMRRLTRGLMRSPNRRDGIGSEHIFARNTHHRQLRSSIAHITKLLKASHDPAALERHFRDIENDMNFVLTDNFLASPADIRHFKLRPISMQHTCRIIARFCLRLNEEYNLHTRAARVYSFRVYKTWQDFVEAFKESLLTDGNVTFGIPRALPYGTLRVLETERCESLPLNSNTAPQALASNVGDAGPIGPPEKRKRQIVDLTGSEGRPAKKSKPIAQKPGTCSALEQTKGASQETADISSVQKTMTTPAAESTTAASRRTAGKSKNKTVPEKNKGLLMKSEEYGMKVKDENRCDRCKKAGKACFIAKDPFWINTPKCANCVGLKCGCSFSEDNPCPESPPDKIKLLKARAPQKGKPSFQDVIAEKIAAEEEGYCDPASHPRKIATAGKGEAARAAGVHGAAVKPSRTVGVAVSSQASDSSIPRSALWVTFSKDGGNGWKISRQ